uniref:Fibronectin type-III domain-containing protein n=1 Tax=Globodera rostochiensis TaxID=31243 RepID=A0A914H1T8_GLORO
MRCPLSASRRPNPLPPPAPLVPPFMHKERNGQPADGQKFSNPIKRLALGILSYLRVTDANIGRCFNSGRRMRVMGVHAHVVVILYAVIVVKLSSKLNRIAVTAYSNHVPSPPRNVNVMQINSSSIKVTWEPPADDAAELFGYNVYKFQIVNDQFVNNLRRAVAIVDRNKLYAYLNDLEPNTEYAIRVAAFNMKGDGELSPLTKQSRILTGGKPPSPPRPQSISLINEFRPVRAKVEWHSPRHTYNLPLKKYILWWRPLELADYQRAEVDPKEQSFVLDNLYSGKEYELNIAAVNEAGTSENATEHLITPTGVPDGEPLNIRYTIFNKRLSILWDAPHWRHRNGNISHYEAELSQLGVVGVSPIRRNVTSQTALFDIDPTKSYGFRVAAATSKGTGILSGELRIDSEHSCGIVQTLTYGSGDPLNGASHPAGCSGQICPVDRGEVTTETPTAGPPGSGELWPSVSTRRTTKTES